MPRRLCLLLPLILASCGKPTSSDGYTFDRKEWDQSRLTVQVVQHPSLQDLQAKGPKVEGRELQAWGKVNPSGVCELHIVDPTKHYAPEFIGHEISHCAFGRFHP